MELAMKTKEDLKTVALGTSKINYLDPRITVAWCKRHEVPIEKVNIFSGIITNNFGSITATAGWKQIQKLHAL